MMTEIQLGPIILSSARFSAMLGLAVFLTVAQLAARKQARLADWAWHTLLIVVIGARIGYILENLGAYRHDPFSILYVWQGGFSPAWGIAAAILNSFRTQAGRAVIPIAAAGLVAWGATTMLTTANDPQGMQLPELPVDTLHGETIALSDQLNRPLVINLWEPWCPPCRREMPMMADAAQDKPEVTIAFVNQSAADHEVQDFLNDLNLEPANVWHSRQSQLGAHFQAVGLPTTLFFTTDGTLAHRHVGEISRVELERQINILQQSATPTPANSAESQSIDHSVPLDSSATANPVAAP